MVVGHFAVGDYKVWTASNCWSSLHFLHRVSNNEAPRLWLYLTQRNGLYNCSRQGSVSVKSGWKPGVTKHAEIHKYPKSRMEYIRRRRINCIATKHEGGSRSSNLHRASATFTRSLECHYPTWMRGHRLEYCVCESKSEIWQYFSIQYLSGKQLQRLN